MGTFNYLLARMICPHCHETVEVEVECFFGYTAEMKTFHVDDHYEWYPRKAVQNGGWPPDGNIDGEGYTDCPACRKDFFLKVVVRGDVIEGVEPDLTKRPYIHDEPFDEMEIDWEEDQETGYGDPG
jgi:hypothetical protein